MSKCPLLFCFLSLIVKEMLKSTGHDNFQTKVNVRSWKFSQTWKVITIEAVVQRCSVKKEFLKIFAKFTGKHLCQSLFFIKTSGNYLRRLLLYLRLSKPREILLNVKLSYQNISALPRVFFSQVLWVSIHSRSWYQKWSLPTLTTKKIGRNKFLATKANRNKT